MSKLKYANGNKILKEWEKDEMIQEAAEYYGRYMTALGFDWKNDPNSSDTPERVARAFVNDLAQGVYSKPPKITAFDNVDGYDGMVFQGNIKLHSLCSHHHLPFVGKAHVAYLPTAEGKVIGLSKLNRIVEFYSRRPQVQENLTMQIHDHINDVCENNIGVAVMIEANHMCTCVRGVKHNSIMKTAKLSGKFKDTDRAREEFYDFIRDLK
jgi:GTP cyclohydrolase I|tara:strand:+ start:1296 stop:1925 length:630 start_codon:yes stop_codon:yes gene_type:complete